MRCACLAWRRRWRRRHTGKVLPLACPCFRGRVTDDNRGWVVERLKAPVLKTGRLARVSWVRIPPHPPPFGLRVAGHPTANIASPKGVGCLPKLRRSVGRLSQSVSQARNRYFGQSCEQRSTENHLAESICISVWYVYFLRLRNGDVYVGSTNDLGRRLKSHVEGLVASTRRLLPAILISHVAVVDEATARSLERYFKSGSEKAFALKRFWPAFCPVGKIV
jgi:putative endonuclease